jgi:hypothetical protein
VGVRERRPIDGRHVLMLDSAFGNSWGPECNSCLHIVSLLPKLGIRGRNLEIVEYRGDIVQPVVNEHKDWVDGTPQGWVPVGVGGRYLIVRWMKVGSSAFEEPFCESMVERLRSQMTPTPELETDITMLERAAVNLPSAKPSGIIYHMTHCGSTLVLNALRTANKVVPAGEAQPIEMLLSLLGVGSRYWAARSSRCVQSIASVFAHYPPPLRLTLETAL